MRTILPVLKVEEINGVVTREESELAVNVIDDITCQIRWEESFPDKAINISLFDYIEPFSKIPPDKHNSATVLSMLKGLFCFLDFERPMSFKEFCGLFKINDYEYLCKIVDRINEIFSKVYPENKKKV